MGQGRNAERAGVKLNTLLQANDEFDFGSARWDLIVITYEPVPVTRADYVARLHASLRPGGLIVIESFASDVKTPGRRPVDIDPAELKQAFGGLIIHRFEDTVANADWGEQLVRLARLIAEKKP